MRGHLLLNGFLRSVHSHPGQRALVRTIQPHPAFKGSEIVCEWTAHGVVCIHLGKHSFFGAEELRG